MRPVSSTTRAALVAAAGVSLYVTGAARAAVFADGVVSYAPGADTSPAYRNPANALGSPDDITGESAGFDNVLSPFSPAFDGDELAQIGAGGHLTLRFAHYVLPSDTGPEIGVIENLGLVDIAFPQGNTGSGPATFAPPAVATVEVSDDGASWVSLGSRTFDAPAIYYTNAGPFDPTAPASPQLADFGQPFTGRLSDFASKTSYADVVAVFGGSGGGTWLDISGLGLDRVGYVRFSLPAGATGTLEVDAVAVANGQSSTIPVPEPTAAAAATLAGLALLGRRTRRR